MKIANADAIIELIQRLRHFLNPHLNNYSIDMCNVTAEVLKVLYAIGKCDILTEYDCDNIKLAELLNSVNNISIK